MHVVTTRRQHKDKVYETVSPAPFLSRGRQGQERDARQPLVPACRHDPADPRVVGRQDPRHRRRGLRHRTGPSPRPCRGALRDGSQARSRQVVRPKLSRTGPGVVARHRPSVEAGLQARHHQVVGRHDPWRRPRAEWHLDRRGVRGHGLALRPSGDHRGIPCALGTFRRDRWCSMTCRARGWRGHTAHLPPRGYSRDHKSGKAQIEYGLLTDQEGRPVSVEVFPGNTADPTAFISAVEAVRTGFGLNEVVMVGDRGMITSARIEALRCPRRHLVDHLPSCPCDQGARRTRGAPALAVRRDEPRRDHPPRLPRRTARRVSQPCTCQRAGSQALGAVGCHRGRARDDRRHRSETQAA